MSAFVGYPCVVRNSFRCGDHWIDEICACVTSECSRAPVVVFQMCTVASDVPPPDASSAGCHGHHATAFTAAVWLRFVQRGAARALDPGVPTSPMRPSQMLSTLSLPPLASSSPSARQRRPHTSPWCPRSSPTLCRATRTSWCQMLPSWQPELRMWLFHESTPTCAACPDIVRSLLCVSTSQSSTAPFGYPTPRNWPSLEKSSEAMYEPSGPSLTSTTSPVSAFQMYALPPSAIPTTFVELHEIRFR
ncbi:hypothetical protein GSI_09378 [Ganoderma sinense ZZ0214-1]|uniref:Uncharacterized protein n=1 Tax=Ganoderma sinense ZZ0214-1 TaxID=1077348 RepID=A0A2G8S6G5_9APHY|nr:hypothetical protein GSI_09378 [Ganoderma sinense ZZ0214-1]